MLLEYREVYLQQIMKWTELEIQILINNTTIELLNESSIKSINSKGIIPIILFFLISLVIKDQSFRVAMNDLILLSR